MNWPWSKKNQKEESLDEMLQKLSPESREQLALKVLPVCILRLNDLATSDAQFGSLIVEMAQDFEPDYSPDSKIF